MLFRCFISHAMPEWCGNLSIFKFACFSDLWFGKKCWRFLLFFAFDLWKTALLLLLVFGIRGKLAWSFIMHDRMIDCRIEWKMEYLVVKECGTYTNINYFSFANGSHAFCFSSFFPCNFKEVIDESLHFSGPKSEACKFCFWRSKENSFSGSMSWGNACIRFFSIMPVNGQILTSLLSHLWCCTPFQVFRDHVQSTGWSKITTLTWLPREVYLKL